jgi:predicted ATPase
MRWLRIRRALKRAIEERESAPPPGTFAEGLDPADLDDALNQIATILGARSVDSAQSDSMTLDEAGNAAKQRIFAAAARLVRFAADSAPIVILCDDIHWADSASLDLLDDLMLRAEDLPILAVCTARPELFERLPAWGEGKAAHTRIDLAPLARRHIEEMVRDWLRRAPNLSPPIYRPRLFGLWPIAPRGIP